MIIVRRPAKHLLHFLLSLIAIPVFLLNLWVIEKGQLVRLLTKEKLIMSIVVTVLVLFSFAFLMKARKKGLLMLGGIASWAIGLNFYYLIVSKNYALAFFDLFLIILSSMYLLSTYKILKLAYYNSKKMWFAGVPKFIPQISAEIDEHSGKLKGRVSNLDHDGCYVFLTKSKFLNGPRSVQLHFKDRTLECDVVAVSKILNCAEDAQGWGLSFNFKNADQQKDISDFIELVRSSGYVE